MSNKRIGFVVVCSQTGGAFRESKARRTKGVLFRGDAATLFPTRGDANRAINRTIDHSIAKGFDWKVSEYHVVAIGKRG